MKIAHCIYLYLPITENWIYEQITGLSDSYKSNILAGLTANLEKFPYEDLVSFNNLNKIRTTILRGSKKLNIRRMPNIWKDKLKNVDIVHSHFGDEGYRNYLTCRKFDKKHIVSFYGYDLTSYLRLPAWIKRYNKMFKYVDTIIVEGSYAKKTLVDIGCEEEIVKVKHFGIDLNSIPHRVRSYDGKRPLNILMAASFVEKKGFPYGIKALGILLKKGMDINLTVIGDASKSNLKLKNEIYSQIEKNNLSKRSNMLGYVGYDRLIEEMMKSDIFLSPNVIASDGDSEGGAPVVLLHAQATGLPVVSTLVCDIPEYVVNKCTGVLVQEKDIEQLSIAIEDVTNNLSAYSSKCRTHIQENYEQQNSIKTLQSIYDNVLS